MDCLAHSFDVARAMQILLSAISMYHVDDTINRLRSRALGTIKGEIPSSTTTMAIVDTKVAVPEDAQACLL